MFRNIFNVKSFVPIVGVFIVLLILPPIIPRFYTYIIALMFVTGLLAMSLNMIVGHGGMFQFHHGAFYGVGISLGSLIWAIAFRWYSLTGGDDGIHGIPMPSILSSLNCSYYFILIVLAICLAGMYLIFKSPFGTTLQAIRDNPQRCEAIGVNVRRHQLAAIVIATFFAGIAGVLFVVLEKSVFPDLLFWVLSLEVLIMCLLGGWFTFLGPMLGAAITVALRTFVGIYTEYWTLILGVILILLIFFLPEGVLGYFIDKFKERGINAMQEEK
ncbi:MAG: branched-chain amino acid ABC transporter permease [Deltaproteobacteria bacterium]|nr:branched-chain amino acid ABC transporter permease [Deltaproteobacteria bacterium]